MLRFLSLTVIVPVCAGFQIQKRTCDHAAPPEGMHYACAPQNPCDCRLEKDSSDDEGSPAPPAAIEPCSADKVKYFVATAYPEPQGRQARNGHGPARDRESRHRPSENRIGRPRVHRSSPNRTSEMALRTVRRRSNADRHLHIRACRQSHRTHQHDRERRLAVEFGHLRPSCPITKSNYRVDQGVTKALSPTFVPFVVQAFAFLCASVSPW
jgi:hypothetical protein